MHKRILISLFLCLHILLANNISAQEVTARYNKDKTVITITNNSGNTIYLFKKDISKGDNPKTVDKNVEVKTTINDFNCWNDNKDGFVRIPPQQTRDINVNRNCRNNNLYYYPCIIINKTKTIQESEQTNILPSKEENTPPALPVVKTDSVKPQEVSNAQTQDKPSVQDNKTAATPEVQNSKPTPASKKSTQKISVSNTSKNALFKTYQNEYLDLYNECRPLLKEKLKEDEIERLKRKLQEFMALKKQVEEIEIKETDKEGKAKKKEIAGKINNLITIVSKHILGETYVAIAADYEKNIVRRYDDTIAMLQDKDNLISDIIKSKTKESDFTKWIGKEALHLSADSVKTQIEQSKIRFVGDHEHFIEKWAKQIKEKEILEGLVVGQKDAIAENYAELVYSSSNYEGKITGLKIPYVLFIVTGIAFFAIVTAVILFVRACLKRKGIEQKAKQKIEDIIRPIEEEIENLPIYTIGLDDVREKEERDYYVVDITTLFEDTAVQTVYISRKCIIDIYRFFSEFLKSTQKTNETGCFVVGRWEYAPESNQQAYNITLEKIVEPGADAVYGEYVLDFGVEIGIGLENLIFTLREKTGKDYMQMCWIHTHPGLGLFLSNHDLIVQSQLAYPDHPNRMLAIVIDSNTENLNMAFFVPKKDGSMNNKEALKKEFSLEEVYQWAKKPQEKISGDLDMDYYSYMALSKDVCMEKILLSGAAIIDMDNSITLNPENLAGYFCGNPLYKTHPVQKYAIIEKFQIQENTENSSCHTIGCLLVEPELSYSDILEKYEPIISRYVFFAIYRPADDSIRFIIKNSNGTFPDMEKDIYPVQLLEMKKWTRRKRI